MEKISAVAVNFNTPFLVERFLNNLYNAYDNLEVIFVNNSPDDGSSQIVKDKFPLTKLIELKNPGLSVGYNVGANGLTSKYILFVGTDAFPEKKAIEGTVEYMENHSDVGAVTTTLVLENGDIDLDAHRGFPTVLNSFFKFSGLYKVFPKSGYFNSYFLGDRVESTVPHEIDAGISHFLLVRRSVFDAINGFDADFFLYGEDIDFCYRVKELGYKIVYLPQFKTLHIKGASIGTRKHNKKELKKPYLYRKKQVLNSTAAMRIFFKKHYSGKYSPTTLKFVFLEIALLEKMRVFSEWLSR